MDMIYGGAGQGKLEYAKAHYEQDQIVDHAEKIVLQCIRKGIEPVAFLKDSRNGFGDKVLIFDDISMGVVPVDEEMRKWRDANGSAMVWSVSAADNVIRVFCGIGLKVK
ncbi:MAG: bifunctional adenosylcobinamide kinase/adenosylcobinamide-phosphate guanylyltransferase [Eubacteriaceae bacterium]|jgi:adenosyl cobinamide kinase/adenosyl cobinamide phosphate guanylyltransferase|nr:bifunctional adenosylcobinamide kinase/adenosylcobinamide-phosphate guanylyltransferase [Eubacteriaceae bacterium]